MLYLRQQHVLSHSKILLQLCFISKNSSCDLLQENKLRVRFEKIKTYKYYYMETLLKQSLILFSIGLNK